MPLYFFISFFRGRFGEKYGFGLIKVCFFFLFFETKAIGLRSMVGLDLAGDHHEFDQNRGRGGRVGLVVRALAFHQCGPGSISLGVIRGLSLLVLYSAMRGFPPGTPVFPSHQKPTFDLI